MSLRDRLTSGSFAVTAEISPPRGASTEPITATAWDSASKRGRGCSSLSDGINTASWR